MSTQNLGSERIWAGTRYTRIFQNFLSAIKQQIVPMIICFEYPDCYFEGCCFPCFEREGTVHKVSLNRPRELIENTVEHKNFLKVCSWDGYDWHEWFLFGRER